MAVRATSAMAYHEIQRLGLLSKARLKVYDILYHNGPLTGTELDTKFGSVSHHKRLAELEELGVVKRLPPITCRVTGQLVEQWDVTDAVPIAGTSADTTPSSGKVKKPPKKVVKQAVDDLRAMIAVSKDDKGVIHYTPKPDVEFSQAAIALLKWLAYDSLTTSEKDAL